MSPEPLSRTSANIKSYSSGISSDVETPEGSTDPVSTIRDTTRSSTARTIQLTTLTSHTDTVIHTFTDPTTIIPETFINSETITETISDKVTSRSTNAPGTTGHRTTAHDERFLSNNSTPHRPDTVEIATNIVTTRTYTSTISTSLTSGAQTGLTTKTLATADVTSNNLDQEDTPTKSTTKSIWQGTTSGTTPTIITSSQDAGNITSFINTKDGDESSFPSSISTSMKNSQTKIKSLMSDDYSVTSTGSSTGVTTPMSSTDQVETLLTTKAKSTAIREEEALHNTTVSETLVFSVSIDSEGTDNLPTVSTDTTGHIWGHSSPITTSREQSLASDQNGKNELFSTQTGTKMQTVATSTLRYSKQLDITNQVKTESTTSMMYGPSTQDSTLSPFTSDQTSDTTVWKYYRFSTAIWNRVPGESADSVNFAHS